MSHANYLGVLFNTEQYQEVVNKISAEINSEKEALGINCIVITGVSGLVIGGAIAYKTSLPIVVVRKTTENNHSEILVEYSNDLLEFRCAFIDDQIASGSTLKRVLRELEKEHKTVLTKIYLYNDSRDRYNVNCLLVPVSGFCYY